MERGLVHIYCGDGKGKTTAAVGLAVRAAGCGKKVLFVRFMKNERSGELKGMADIPEIDFLYPERYFGFYSQLSSEEQASCKEVYHRLWEAAVRECEEDKYDLLILDEFMSAYQCEVIDRQKAVHFLTEKPDKLEVILTGRNPAPEVEALADYISEICKVRHPYDRGIMAKEGIEY